MWCIIEMKLGFFFFFFMNLCMYCDDEKNLMMFLPDTVSDEEIMTLGEVVFPDDDGEDLFDYNRKPTGCINLYNMYASYPVDLIRPDSIIPFM